MTSNTCDNSQVSETQNQFEETRLVQLRKHGSVLLLPTLLLLLVSGLVTFFLPKLSEPWQQQLLLVAGALAGLLFWLVPSIRFLSNRFELTSNRVVIRTGLFGTKSDQVAWGELSGVSVQRGFGLWLKGAGNVHLHRTTGEDLVLPHVPKAKRLAREIESYLSQRSSMRK